LLQGQLGQGITPYAGQTVPGISPLQQQGFGAAGGLSPMAAGAMGYFQGALGQQAAGGGPAQQMATWALPDMLAPFDPAGATEFWQQAHVAPAMETWRQDIMPSITESFAARGAADSGAMNRALARGGANLATGLSGQLANLLYSGQQAQMGRQQMGINQAMNLAMLPGNIVGQAGQIGGMGTDMVSQLLNIGGQQRGIAGEQLQEPYTKWQQAQPYNSPWLGLLRTALQSAPPMTPVVQQGSPGLGSQLLPALGAFAGTEEGAGMIGSLGADILGGIGSLGASILSLSDIRLKENFARLEGALDKVKKLEGMTYNFIGEDRRSAGIIAQELEKVLPEGVEEREGVKFIRVNAVIGLLVNAINELNQKIKGN